MLQLLISLLQQFFLITFLTFLLVPWTIYTFKPKSACVPSGAFMTRVSGY